MGFLTKLFEKGKLNPKQMVKLLKKHEDRLDALEGGEGKSADNSLKNKVDALETRVKALEDAQ